jgi:hypothetical protein
VYSSLGVPEPTAQFELMAREVDKVTSLLDLGWQWWGNRKNRGPSLTCLL